MHNPKLPNIRMVLLPTIISHDVIFNESDFPGLSVMENKNESNIPLLTLFSIEPGVVPNMQPPPDPAPPETKPDIDDPTDHPNQVPPPIPAAPPCHSDHVMIRQDYCQLHDPFLCPHPTPDHNDPGPEGGAAANTSTIQAVVDFPYISLYMHPIRPHLWSPIVKTSLLTTTCKKLCIYS